MKNRTVLPIRSGTMTVPLAESTPMSAAEGIGARFRSCLGASLDISCTPRIQEGKAPRPDAKAPRHANGPGGVTHHGGSISGTSGEGRMTRRCQSFGATLLRRSFTSSSITTMLDGTRDYAC